MIYTGDCDVSRSAARALRRAAARAAVRGSSFASQLDLLVALLQARDPGLIQIYELVPRLAHLSLALRQPARVLRRFESVGTRAAITAGTPLQTVIELSAEAGRITSASLLRALLNHPRSHLLALAAREYNKAVQTRGYLAVLRHSRIPR
jgi:hypothetical protein